MNNLIELSHKDIVRLFEQGDCLTFHWFYSQEFAKYKNQLRQEFNEKFGDKCLVVSKRAAFTPNGSNYHYFSNGVLLCNASANPQSVFRFEEILENNGFKVSRRITDIHPKSMREISEFAANQYVPQDDLQAIPYPNKEEFTQKLFENGNTCLSASKDEDINPECRQYLALFADGRFIVSEKFSLLTGIYDFRKVTAFSQEYSKYLYLELEMMPQEYIDYIYQKAAEYDWYISPEEALKKYQSSHPLSQQSLSREEEQFITELLKDNKCLSVVSPRRHLSPDWDKYALFADGRLIIDNSKAPLWQNNLAQEISKVYPALELKIELKPVYLIDEIYKRLLNRQKSARDIYTEMMKQKARKLKKMLNIPHHEALELAAHITGWKSWKEITQIDEARARYVISAEKYKKELAQQHRERDPVEDEYERYSFSQRLKKNKA